MKKLYFLCLLSLSICSSVVGMQDPAASTEPLSPEMYLKQEIDSCGKNLKTSQEYEQVTLQTLILDFQQKALQLGNDQQTQNQIQSLKNELREKQNTTWPQQWDDFRNRFDRYNTAYTQWYQSYEKCKELEGIIAQQLQTMIDDTLHAANTA